MPDEHVLEAFGGLGDQVQVAALGPRRRLGEVEPLALQLLPACRGGELVGGLRVRRSQVLLRFVERSPDRGSLVRRQRAQALLDLPERSFAPEQR